MKNNLVSVWNLELIEKIRQAWDSGPFTYGVFLDLQKAFDTVNYNILLRKLENH